MTVKNLTQRTGERDCADDVLMGPRVARLTAMYRFCLPYIQNRKVLEVGCGTGHGSAVLAESAAEVLGIDSDALTVQEAREGFSTDKLRFETMDGCALDLADGSFDAAVSMLVIEHIKDYRCFIAETARVLKPNGMYLLGALNRRTSLEDDAYHYREFAKQDLERMLAPHFDDVEVFGLRGVTDRAVAHREQRIRRAMKYWRFDVLGLRRLYFVKCLYRPLFDRLQRKGHESRRGSLGNDFDEISPDDFLLRPDDDAGAWTFVAVGRKR